LNLQWAMANAEESASRGGAARLRPGGRRRHGWRSVLLLVVACCGLAANAGQEQREDLSRGAAANSAVVQLVAIGPGARDKNRECAATGFFVNEDGYILTNAHVIEDAQACLARSAHGKILAKVGGSGSATAPAFSCELVGLDETHDLAVLKTERPLATNPKSVPYALLDLHDVEEGAPVLVAGHPTFAWQPVTQTGKVVQREMMDLSVRSSEKSEVLVLDIALKPGNSGSPVYRAETQGVVGVVVSRDPSLPSQTVALTIPTVIALLDRCGVKWHAGER